MWQFELGMGKAVGVMGTVAGMERRGRITLLMERMREVRVNTFNVRKNA